MLLAAEEIDGIKSLLQNWPILSLLTAAIAAFYRGIAQPMLARHIQYLDTSEVQIRANTENGIRQTAILDSLLGESKEHSVKLAEIKELATQAKSKYEGRQ